MKATNFLRAGMVLAVGALISLVSLAKEPADQSKKGQTLAKGAGTPVYAVLNINNLTTWLRADGHSNHSPSADDGLYYPRGTGSAIYQDCVVWGGKVYTDATYATPGPRQSVRVGGGTYGIGTRAGKILNPTLGPAIGTGIEDPQATDVRIYRIRRDYYTISDADLKRDAAVVNEVNETAVTDPQMAAVKAQYALDWAYWPVAKGAPFIDRNGNGVYDPPPAFNTDATAGPVFTVDSLIAQGRDEPGVAGGDPNSPADQVIWTVYNDLTVSTALAFEGSEPFGLEIQKTVWGYKRTDALGNLYFNRFKLINKGGVDTSAAAGDQYGAFWIDSMYVCQWSDPDLGNAGDDLLGTDSLLSLGYCFNGNAVDAEYRGFNLPPPAVGYDFLAGPLYNAPGDSAVFDLKRVYGKANRPMSSFSYFSAGSPYSDPPTGTGAYLNGTGRWWKMLRGFAPLGDLTTPDQPYAHPPGAPITKYPLSGNPVAGTGFIDGEGTSYSFAAGDRRLLCTTGPFQMAPGDTQEIYVGVVAGIGADRLTSISVMKFNDRFVQNTFNALFQVPRAPAPPDVKVAELDGQIVLEWGSNKTRVANTETKVNEPGSYVFEGYNVYQLPARGSQLSEGRRIATFDLATDPTVILDEQFDQTSGQILSLPVQFGTNSGITRHFTFDRDHLLDINKLYNGQEYYLVVTAYSRATVAGYLPAVLESDPVVITVQPKVEFGKVFANVPGDTLATTHIGTSDGVVIPVVVNPAAANGKTYEVRFDTTGGSMTWYLRNTTDGVNVLIGQVDQSASDPPIVDGGVQLYVTGPPAPGLKADAWVWNGTRFMTWANADGYAFEEFLGAWGWETPQHFFGIGDNRVDENSLYGVRIVFAAHGVDNVTAAPYAATLNGPNLFDTSDDDTASYAYRYLRGATAAPARPHFAPWIVNAAGGYRYQDYRISAPLAAYNTDVNPPARLAIGYLENNQPNGMVDGYYWPAVFGAVPGGNNTAANSPREWLFILNHPYTGATPNAALQTDILNNLAIQPIYWSTWLRRNTNAWPDGNSFELTPNRPNTVNDIFRYTVTAPASSVQLEKFSAAKVGVFPNPYYAFNAAETNRFQRFVTFNNLPPVAKIRIFNLAGQLVRVLDKNEPSQFLRWNIMNQAGFPVASGMYVAHIEMTLPSDGSTVTKVLKLGVIQEQEILNTY